MTIPTLDLQHESEVALRNAPLVETALDAKVEHMQAMDLLIIAGSILKDSEFNEVWQPGEPAIDAARRLTREQKLRIRARVCKNVGLKMN